MVIYYIMILLIVNTYPCHYEIIESVLIKYHEIFKLNQVTPFDIYLHIYPNQSFQSYLISRFPKITFGVPESYDYYINCTVYDKDIAQLDTKSSRRKYIAHEITPRLQSNPNVVFLTPLGKTNFFYADILPYSNQRKLSQIPIYVIQGNLVKARRYLDLLKNILNRSYSHKFIIKLIGRGNFPKELEDQKEKIVLRNNLNFIDYHKEFLDAYCILPLISKRTHPRYYCDKLTSSINYARGYNLRCIIDSDLQKIYNLKNAEIYNSIHDIADSFENTLIKFYNGDST